MAKAPRSADLGWRYGEMVRGRKDRVRCNYCHRVVPGGITHFKRHFIGNRKGTGACISAPEEVREIIRRHFNEPQETRVNCVGAGEHQDSTVAIHAESGLLEAVKSPVSPKFPMAKAPCSVDIGWRYGEMVRGRKDRVKCNYCHRVVPGGITHFKRHFIGNRKGIGACISASEEVREIIRRHFNEPQETRVNCVGAGEHQGLSSGLPPLAGCLPLYATISCHQGPQDSTVAIHAESGLLEAMKSPVAKTPKFSMAKAPCSADIGWRYGEMVRGRKDRVRCNYCHRVVPGGITHFKRHFIGNRKGTGACISSPEEVREIIRRHFNEPQETRVNCVGTGEHQALSSGLPPLVGCLPLYATISCHQGPQDSTVAIHAESGLPEVMKSPVAKTPKFPMAKTPCSADIGWRYGEMVRGRKDRVRCNYCHRVVPGGITHFKRHFIGNKKGIGACVSASEEVREIIREHLNESEQKRVNRIDARKLGNRRTKIMTRRAMMELRASETAHTECVFDSHPCHPSKEVSVRKRKHIGSKEQRKLTSEKDTIQSFYSSLPLYTQAKRLRGIKERIRSSKEQKKLDTNVFESYLEYLWSSIPDKKRESYTYLDCLWFSLYKKGPSQSKVLTWIKKKQIFSRQYVFVPIICWRHWSLLILCHFGESFLSKDKQPCMLLLDSLGKIDPMRLEPDIRRFVLDIYKTKGCEEDSISKIPLLVPKVPQQRNGEECGIFVLYFIHLFLQSAPKAFSQEGYPYFLTESWFTWEDMEKFRKGVLDFASRWRAAVALVLFFYFLWWCYHRVITHVYYYC